MLRRNTLFIVGAGGSHDYQFPTGKELIDRILSNLCKRERGDSIYLGDNSLISSMQILADNKQIPFKTHLYQAREKLQHILAGGPVSIDNVVHTHGGVDPYLADVAKLCIAQVISTCEMSCDLLKTESGTMLKHANLPANTWLGFLFERLFAGQKAGNLEELLSTIRFISFNYDRCIAQAARRKIAGHFQLKDADAIAIADKLEILHPYGHLGPLPSISSDSNDGFGQFVDAKSIVRHASRIRTFTEGIDDEELQHNIANALDWAECLVFVGFGYIALNMNMLQRRKSTNPLYVYGSTFRMPEYSKVVVMGMLKSQFGNGPVEGVMKDHDAMKFIEEYERGIFS